MRGTLVANMLLSVGVTLCVGVLIYAGGAADSAAAPDIITDAASGGEATDAPSDTSDASSGDPLVTPASTTAAPSPENPVTIAPDRMAALCEQLTLTFNSLNTLLPMIYYFDGSKEVGISYPPGKISIESGTKTLNGCSSYKLPSSGAVIAHLEVSANLELELPQYEIEGKNCTVTFKMRGTQVVIHYSLLQSSSPGKADVLHMGVIMGELKSLGSVEIASDYPGLDGRDFSLEAEDVIRPKLFESFNRFAKEQLTWDINPDGSDSSNDGFDSFKLIFKRQMIQLNRAFA